MKLVTVHDITQHIDDRGMLYEIIRTDAAFKPVVNQVYFAFNRTAGIIRAFHKHHELWDYFHIASGSAKFVFFTDRNDVEVVVLDSRKPQLIVVPPGVYHGWISLEPNTALVSVASHCYNREKPDEERIDPMTLGQEIWKVKAK